MTRRELQRILDSEGFDPRRYSLRGGLPDERYCIDRLASGRWSVYGSERGEKVAERLFASEDEACHYLLALLRRDPSARSPPESVEWRLRDSADSVGVKMWR